MSAAEIHKAADTLTEEWEVKDSDTAEDAASAFTLIDLLQAMGRGFDDLPTAIAARALAFARVINGGAS